MKDDVLFPLAKRLIKKNNVRALRTLVRTETRMYAKRTRRGLLDALLSVAVTAKRAHAVKCLLTFGVPVESPAWPPTNLDSAVSAGDAATVKILLEGGAHPFARTRWTRYYREGGSVAAEAAEDGNKEIVRLLVKHGALRHVAMGRGGWSLLHYAVWWRDFKLVKLILAQPEWQKHDDYSRDWSSGGYQFWSSPLHDAVDVNSLEIVKALIDGGMQVDGPDTYRWTPLHWAVERQNERLVRLLLAKGANPNARGARLSLEGHLGDGYQPVGEGLTALLIAAEANSLSLVKMLLLAGADVNECDSEGKTPLMAACGVGSMPLVKLLVKAGADVGQQDQDGYTAEAHLAEWALFPRFIRALVDVGANVNVFDSHGKTLLMKACSEGSVPLSKLLMKAGADSKAVTKYGTTAMHFAARAGTTRLIHALAKAGCSVSATNKCGFTPLHFALLPQLVEEDAARISGYELASKAVPKGQRDVIRALLALGADVNALTQKNETATAIARRSRNRKLVMFLRSHGGKLTMRKKSDKIMTTNREGEKP